MDGDWQTTGRCCCRVKMLDIAGLIDVGKTRETFSPDRSSNGLMARRDLGDWPPCYGKGVINYKN